MMFSHVGLHVKDWKTRTFLSFIYLYMYVCLQAYAHN